MDSINNLINGKSLSLSSILFELLWQWIPWCFTPFQLDHINRDFDMNFKMALRFRIQIKAHNPKPYNVTSKLISSANSPHNSWMQTVVEAKLLFALTRIWLESAPMLLLLSYLHLSRYLVLENPASCMRFDIYLFDAVFDTDTRRPSLGVNLTSTRWFPKSGTARLKASCR